eukprot:scaffold106433_cov30-Tisochrysis_lutea.AAC.2
MQCLRFQYALKGCISRRPESVLLWAAMPWIARGLFLCIAYRAALQLRGQGSWRGRLPVRVLETLGRHPHDHRSGALCTQH